MTCHAASARCTRSMTDGIAVIERVLSRPTANEGGAMASLHGACLAWPTLRSFLHSKWLAKKSREVYEKLLAKSWESGLGCGAAALMIAVCQEATFVAVRSSNPVIG